MRPAAIILAAMALAALPACKPAFDLRLASNAEQLPRPNFVVQSRDAPETRPEYHTVRVIQRPSGTLVWHLRANPFNKDTSQANLQYGVTPLGFEAVTPALKLQPNSEYSLVVSGTAHGELRFTTNAKGRLSAPD